jgi:DNA-binding CsgD family transcriptional regulator
MPPSIHPHNRAQIQARERRVWDRYVIGHTHEQIAADEQVARPMISRIISRCVTRATAQLTTEAVETKVRQLALVRKIIAECCAAWDRSKLAKARITRKKSGHGEPAGEAHSTEAQVGTVAYLRLAIDAMEREAKILGLDAPQKVAPTDPSGTRA